MKQTLLVLIFALPLFSFAQRDAPVWESYLTRTSIYNNNRTSSVLELDYKKEGGHYVHDHHDRRNHVYSFKFHFEHKALFETVESLVNFDSENVSVYGTKKDITLYGDKFKMMVFVPVNTSPYATKIPMNLRKQYDFPPRRWRLRPIHYFRPLPYVFELKRVSDGFLLYKN